MSIDVFGYIAGAFGILALGYGVLCSQLPQAKYKELEAVLKDTEDILQESCENGLLTDPAIASQIEDDLWRLVLRLFPIHCQWLMGVQI
jgi:hypothetical protein